MYSVFQTTQMSIKTQYYLLKYNKIHVSVKIRFSKLSHRKGDKREYANQKSVTFLNVTYKVLSGLLLRNLEKNKFWDNINEIFGQTQTTTKMFSCYEILITNVAKKLVLHADQEYENNERKDNETSEQISYNEIAEAIR